MFRRIVLVAVYPLVLIARIGSTEGGDGDEPPPSGFDGTSAIRLAQDAIDRFAGSRRRRRDGGAGSERPPQATSEEERGSAVEENDPVVGSDDGSDLIEWIVENSGFVHPNARIGLDPSGGYRGAFVKSVEEEDEGGALSGIKSGDTIASIPWDLIIKPKDYQNDVYWSCEGPRELHRQFLLGDDESSNLAPYVNYLRSQPAGRIPSEWTDAGRELLRRILDHESNLMDDEFGNGLPPKQVRADFTKIWIDECGGEDTPSARAAFSQFVSRDEDTLMVPFYDMLNHSNDREKLNTITHKPRKEGEPFTLRATRDVAPGEQLYNSYNRCHRTWHDGTYRDCTTWSHYGTSDLFDVFGFVEDFPQSWSYRIDIRGGEGSSSRRARWDDLVFSLEDSDDGTLRVMFGSNYVGDPAGELPGEAHLKYMSDQLVRLNELESSTKEDGGAMLTMPDHEWEMAWRYHEALVTSISSAILAAPFADGESVRGVVRIGDPSSDDTSDDSSDNSSDARNGRVNDEL